MARDSGWDSETVVDLSKHFSKNLHTCFQTAVKKISDSGYSKENAEDTVLKCGPFYGLKDMVSCIVDRAFDSLERRRCHTWYTFKDINSLVEYMMLEMVTIVRYVKPYLSVHEAMWTLLICDLNILIASVAEIDLKKFLVRDFKPAQQGPTSSKHQIEMEIPSQDQESIPVNVSKPEISEEKCQCCKKWCSPNKRDAHRHKAFSFEKKLMGQMSKKALKEKFASLGNLCLDNQQSPSGPSSVSKKDLKLPKVTAPKPEGVPPEPCKIADYYLAGIPFDESKGVHVPQDDKDKIILAALGRLQSLQKEVKSWEDWASLKVMQVAKRLSQDGPEIKRLKAEKADAQNSKKDEESTNKKLSELTAALTDTDCQFKMSNSTIARLESENSALKREKEIAEKQTLIEAKSLEEALCKEREALKKFELFGSEKNLLEEDLKSLKREVGPKQQALEKAKHLLKETEARLAREEQEAGKLHEQAEAIRNERERLQALADAGDDRAIKRVGKELKEFETEIKRIQYEIAALNLEAETKKIAVLTGMSWQLSEGMSPSECSRSSFTNHECVMCLTEETSVLFVPCGHQVLCGECNLVHEDNGMKECPSCRTPIQKRINCLFAAKTMKI
ncbi:putative E3 ubiquitin-protein ligase RF298 [Bidens hawaiensis]|uniref:putative E3 ubiquitin-protein ligase RF298 n=1 Tax=Bidens hawaiensis TaxID=980011 RepID=UPI004049BF2F